MTTVIRTTYSISMGGNIYKLDFNTLGEVKAFLGSHWATTGSGLNLRIIKNTYNWDSVSHNVSMTSEYIDSF